MNKNNSKRAYQLVKDLTFEKQDRSSTIQGRSGECLTENKRFSADGQNITQDYTTMRVVVTMQFLDCSQPHEEELRPNLRDKVEIAVASLKKNAASTALRLHQASIVTLIKLKQKGRITSQLTI